MLGKLAFIGIAVVTVAAVASRNDLRLRVPSVESPNRNGTAFQRLNGQVRDNQLYSRFATDCRKLA
jgi:hypothetical protein